MNRLLAPFRLALQLLTHERRRLFACVGGISFALILMLLQVGFRSALLDSAVELLRQLDADIVVMDKEKDPFLSRDPMPRERVYQALSVPGVAESTPVWVGLLNWRNHETNTFHPIRVIGTDPDRYSFLMDGLEENRDALKQLDHALVDRRSRSSYGDLNPDPAQIGTHQVKIAGQIDLGTDFEADGTMLVSEETYFRMTGIPQHEVEMALLKLEPNANPDRVAAALRQALPTDVTALTKEALLARDLEYWETGTPISVILLVGVALGMLVGVIICYQVLYTEVLDHLPEFATLKAMGYSNRFLEGVVLSEAVILSFLAVIPALLFASAMLAVLGWMSGLSTGLNASQMVQISLFSLGMCCFAAFLALGKIRRLDPAELF
ncbi:MAG: ABC transporter permease DevC [Myxococcota bacterium]|nr:ABC transporter permease DevC [Myxococcota bacterium]